MTAGLALIAGLVLACADPALAHVAAVEEADASRGIVVDGLSPGGDVCPGAFVLASDLPGRPRCSHGPDEPLPGVDVSADAATMVLPDSAPPVECYGDGTDGRRVQAVYAVAADRPDRYDALVGGIRQDAKDVDTIFAGSAAATGGVRHVRFVTGAGCVVEVAKAVMSAGGDDSFTNTINELAAQGFNRSDRKYLIWVDANVYCGIANVNGDDRKTASNWNNSGPDYARADAGCWGGHTEAHELMHTLGGVQLSAPHTSGGYHCVDEYDVMCYSDSPNFPAMQIVCLPQATNENILDCGHDDYFHTDPPAGNYLASHWNSADSGFLATTGGGDDRGVPDIHVEGQGRPPPASVALATLVRLDRLLGADTDAHPGLGARRAPWCPLRAETSDSVHLRAEMSMATEHR